VRCQFDQGHGLCLGYRLLAGAFQDEVPGVGVGEGSAPVQGRAEAPQEGAVPECDAAQVGAGGADRGDLGPVPGPGGVQPGAVQAAQEVRGAGRGAGGVR
jgi:hypothetical protein